VQVKEFSVLLNKDAEIAVLHGPLKIDQPTHATTFPWNLDLLHSLAPLLFPNMYNVSDPNDNTI